MRPGLCDNQRVEHSIDFGQTGLQRLTTSPATDIAPSFEITACKGAGKVAMPSPGRVSSRETATAWVTCDDLPMCLRVRRPLAVAAGDRPRPGRTCGLGERPRRAPRRQAPRGLRRPFGRRPGPPSAAHSRPRAPRHGRQRPHRPRRRDRRTPPRAAALPRRAQAPVAPPCRLRVVGERFGGGGGRRRRLEGLLLHPRERRRDPDVDANAVGRLRDVRRDRGPTRPRHHPLDKALGGFPPEGERLPGHTQTEAGDARTNPNGQRDQVANHVAPPFPSRCHGKRAGRSRACRPDPAGRSAAATSDAAQAQRHNGNGTSGAVYRLGGGRP